MKTLYKVEYKRSFLKALRKIDKKDAARISKWLIINVIETDNPMKRGLLLSGTTRPLYRYRIGKYRVVAEIFQSELILIFVDVAKREDIYRHLDY